MRITKIFIVIQIIVIIIIVFTACTILRNDENTEIESELPPITFTALYTYSDFEQEWGELPISQEITKQTGVTLDLWRLPGSQSEALGVLASSNNFPELLLSVDNAVVAYYADAGKLIPLDGYIDEFGENIKQIFGDDINKMRYATDGNIYGFNRSYKEIHSYSEALFNVQYAVLKEYGYPRINTLDELYDMIENYKSKYPQINGHDTIGLSAWSQSYGMNVTIVNPALQAGGYQNDGIFTVDDDLNVVYGLKTQEAHDYFKWMNKLYRNGLLDESSVIQGRDAYRDKVTSGSVLVTTAPYWDLNEMEIELREKGLAENCYAPLPLTLTEDTVSNISKYDPNGTWKSVITTNCKDPERAFRFFDQMWSYDMQILCNWGIEGIHYDVVDSKRVLKDEIINQRANDPKWKQHTELHAYDFWCMGENAVDDTLQYISPFGNREDIIRAQDEATKDALDAYYIETWRDLCPDPVPSEWGFAWTLVLPNNTEGAIAESKVQEDLRRRLLPQIILSDTDEEFEANWTQFMLEIDASGIDNREDEIKELLIERTDSWE